jgi:hypothetical protein
VALVWQLARGEARTFVRPHTRRMYLLVFGASANCMAMHGVGDLEQRVWPPGEMYGNYQRYSLSGSAQYVDGAGHSDLLQLSIYLYLSIYLSICSCCAVRLILYHDIVSRPLSSIPPA